MKIRSITFFCNPGWPLDDCRLRQAGEFIAAARAAFNQAGYDVQTARLATVPFVQLVPRLGDDVIRLAQGLEAAAKAAGLDYVSLGPALPETLDSYPLIPDALAATERVFFSGALNGSMGISLPAVRACAEVIWRAGRLSADGFANLRFCAAANVPAGAPFFPAAYHDRASPVFALATEAADLAVDAFGNAASLEEARSGLRAALEYHGGALCGVARTLEAQLGIGFGGIDFSLAPFPQEALSLGAALERLGVAALGQHGSLAAAAILAETLDRANFPHAGFSGLMLPVLEDAVLARRAADGTLTVRDLLLYSAVCGTGLDTVPLPGETTAEELAAVLLDVAALAMRLDKPLTARLMPIPGKRAGDVTGFDFAYFANSRVMALQSAPLERFLAGGESFDLQPRQML